MISQLNHHIRISIDLGDRGKSTGSLPDEILILRSVKGKEGISQLFSYELEVLSYDPNLHDLPLGKKATIHLHNKDGILARVINGTIMEFENTGRSCRIRDISHMYFYIYRAVLMPDIFKLTMNCRTKVYHDMTVPEIIENVIKNAEEGNAGFSSPLSPNYCDFSNLSGSYKKLNCVVQYMESDFDFISRLMEEEGISYYFEHTEENHKMKLVSNENGFSEYPNVFPYNTTSAESGIYGFRRKNSFLSFDTERYPTVRDFSYRMMGNSYQGVMGDTNTTNPVYREYVPFARFLENTADMDSYVSKGAELRQKYFKNKKEAYWGCSHEPVIRAGEKILLANFPEENSPTLNILITELNINAKTRYELIIPEENIRENATIQENNDEDVFYCEFKGIKGDNLFVPSISTPKPKIYGFQTAVVLTTENATPSSQEEVTKTDEYARVMVKPAWADKNNQTNKNEFLWARVAQNYAGNGFGEFRIPRVGEEVVISFVNGNPEEPLVVGSVYNSVAKPPIEISSGSDNHPDWIMRSKVVSKENTWEKGNTSVTQREPLDEIDIDDLKDQSKRKGYNELSIIDTEDKQRIGIYSNQDVLVQAPEEITIKAGQKLTIEAGAEIELKVGHSRISLQEESLDIGIIGDMEFDLLPAIWSLKTPGTGTFFELTPNKAELTATEVHLIGWYTALMQSMYSTIKAELISVDMGAHNIGLTSGFCLNNLSSLLSYITALAHKGEKASSTFSGYMALLSTIGSVTSLFSKKALLGSSYTEMIGGKVEHCAGFMKIPILGDLALPGLGELEAKSTGDIKSEAMFDHKEAACNKKLIALKNKTTIVKNKLLAMKHKVTALIKKKQVVDEDSEAIEMEEMNLSKEESNLEESKEALSSESTALSEEKANVMENSEGVMKENMSALDSEENGIESHQT